MILTVDMVTPIGYFAGMDKPFTPRPISDLLEARQEMGEREKNIGPQIRAMRKERGITQSALAAQVEVTTPYLNRIEHGHKPPSDRILRNLLDVLEGKEVDADGESQGEGK